MNPSPDQIRSRQTAYLATEHWWRSRVEELETILTKRAQAWYEQRRELSLSDAVGRADADGKGRAFDQAAYLLRELLAQKAV